MSSRAPAGRRLLGRCLAALASCTLLLPALALAQTPADQDAPSSGSRLRDRYRAPQNSQKLDDSLKKLKSEDPETRLEGLRGLGELNDPKGLEYLVGAANDPDMRIRIKAIDVLGNIRAKDATPLLVQQLFMRATDQGTKQRILASLGKIGDSRATGPIVDFMARDLQPAVRGNAIFALGEIGDRAALPSLENLTKDGNDEMVRSLATEAIRKIKEKPEPPVIPPALAGDRRGQGGPGAP